MAIQSRNTKTVQELLRLGAKWQPNSMELLVRWNTTWVSLLTLQYIQYHLSETNVNTISGKRLFPAALLTCVSYFSLRHWRPSRTIFIQ